MPKGFATTPAGSDIGVLTPISEYESQTIQPVAVVSHTNSNWTPGQAITFRWQSSASRWFVPHNSRLKIRLTVKQGAGGAPVSVRLAANAVSHLFSSVRYQLNNKTIEHRASDYGLYANFMTRCSVGKSASKTAGDASLYSFDRRMSPIGKDDDLDIPANAADYAPVHNADPNHKQMILQKVGTDEFEISEIVHLDCWQGEQFWPGGSHELELLVSQNWDKDFLVSEQVQHTPAYDRNTTTKLDAVDDHQFRFGAPECFDGGTSAVLVPTVQIKSVEWEAFYATPLVSPMRIPSMQIKYRVSQFHERRLAGSQFNESFQVQPGVTGICAFARIKASNINIRTEQFAAAGAGVAGGTYGWRLTDGVESGVLRGTTGGTASKAHVLAKAITSFQAELGGKTVPKQMFTGLNFQKYQCSRVYSAYLNFMDNAGATKADMMSLQEFVDSPLIFLHVLLPPREAATTLRLTGTLAEALGATTQQYLSCFTFSNSVLELLYESNSDEPTRIRGPEAIV